MTMTISGSGTITGLSAGGLPDSTIVQADLVTGVAGTGPAFSAYKSGSNQTISAATLTKVSFQAEEFDTNNNFDSTTNYRFTPTVAGYYQINACLYFSTVTGFNQALIYKNGSVAKSGNIFGSTSPGAVITASALIYCNGSTDYIEIYGYQSIGGDINQSVNYTYFQAFLARAA